MEVSEWKLKLTLSDECATRDAVSDLAEARVHFQHLRGSGLEPSDMLYYAQSRTTHLWMAIALEKSCCENKPDIIIPRYHPLFGAVGQFERVVENYGKLFRSTYGLK